MRNLPLSTKSILCTPGSQRRFVPPILPSRHQYRQAYLAVREWDMVPCIPFLYSRGTGRMIPDGKSLKMIPSEFRYHFLDGKMILGENNTLREKTLQKWYRQSSGTIFEQPRLEYSEISDVEKAYNFHFWHGFHCIFRCFSKKSPTASELTIIFVFSWYHWTSLLLWNSRLTCP